MCNIRLLIKKTLCVAALAVLNAELAAQELTLPSDLESRLDKAMFDFLEYQEDMSKSYAFEYTYDRLKDIAPTIDKPDGDARSSTHWGVQAMGGEGDRQAHLHSIFFWGDSRFPTKEEQLLDDGFYQIRSDLRGNTRRPQADYTRDYDTDFDPIALTVATLFDKRKHGVRPSLTFERFQDYQLRGGMEVQGDLQGFYSMAGVVYGKKAVRWMGVRFDHTKNDLPIRMVAWELDKSGEDVKSMTVEKLESKPIFCEISTEWEKTGETFVPRSVVHHEKQHDADYEMITLFYNWKLGGDADKLVPTVQEFGKRDGRAIASSLRTRLSEEREERLRQLAKAQVTSGSN